MSDDVPLKLPRYVFRRANGSFRYKRNVPLRLRVLLGKTAAYSRKADCTAAFRGEGKWH